MLGREGPGVRTSPAGRCLAPPGQVGGLCRVYSLSYYLLGRRVADEAGPMPRATHALHLYPCGSRVRGRR